MVVLTKDSTIIRTGGGTFDPEEHSVYFIASGPGRLRLVAEEQYKYLLIAVNEIEGEGALSEVEQWIDMDCKVFVDSGIFNLTNIHKRAHGISMDEALSLAPEEIDGFDKLFERYVEVCRRFEDRCWGYIELDQGGRENKIKTRARLEEMGLRPIPVYHPLNDGWDYFDYLAERYDRICFGNVVQAPPPIRKRLVATAWERKRKYPHLWIHLLGLTANHWLYGFPINSCDSSSWLVGIRWAASDKEKTAGAYFSTMPVNYRYSYGAEPSSITGAEQAVKWAAYRSDLMVRNWHNHTEDWLNLGFEILPAPVRRTSGKRRSKADAI